MIKKILMKKETSGDFWQLLCLFQQNVYKAMADGNNLPYIE